MDGSVPVPMSRDLIAEVVASFAAAAQRCEEGGIAGVELHAGHCYLFHQFLSPVINRREDEYGGSLENRMRLLRETLAAIRRAVSPGFSIGVRLSHDALSFGLQPEDTAQVVALLEAAGLIDFINGARGGYYAAGESIVPAMEYPVGSLLPVTRVIVAGASRITRILTPRQIRTLEEAEQLLREGAGDLIVMQRALIADPDVIRKTREGRVDDVRPCI
jgi:2,4-dienoyl-CoA reductase-like NADH-dependent reductase (Old Yellow Enzyme family)